MSDANAISTKSRAYGARARRDKPPGPKSFYRKRYASQASVLAMQGASDAQIADFFDISIGTLNSWKLKHEQLRDALCSANDALTPWIERSFAHRALGYDYDDEKVFYDSGRGSVVRVPIRVHVPPDIAAAKHWLERCGAPKWRAQPLQLDIRAQVRDWSAEELAAALQRAQETLELEAQSERESD